MSRSITAEITVDVRQQLMQELAASPRSRLVADLALPLMGHREAALRDGTAVGLLTARSGALAGHGDCELAVKREAPELLANSRRLLAESEREMARGNAAGSVLLAQEGDRRLREALRTTAATLAVTERKHAAGLLRGALTSIGCRTTLHEENGLAGLCAERGHQRVVALVDDGGLVKLDIAGCEGDSCEPLQRDLERAVVDLGGAVEHVEARAHPDERGGALIQHAALSAEGDTLAEGVIRQEVARRRRTAENRGNPAFQRLGQSG